MGNEGLGGFAVRVFNDFAEVITQEKSLPVSFHVIGENRHLSSAPGQIDDIVRGGHA